MADEILLDAFVEIKPRMAADFDEVVNQAKQKISQMFASVQATQGAAGAAAGGGGARPPGTSSPEQQAQRQFNQRLSEARDLIRELRQQTTFAAQDLRALGQADLANPFRVAQRELSNLSRELQTVSASQETLARRQESLESIRYRLLGETAEDPDRTATEGLVLQIAQARQNIFRAGGAADIQVGLANQFTEANQAIRETRLQLSRVIEAADTLENKQVSAEFKRFRNEIADIDLRLKEAFDVSDTAGLDTQLRRIRDIQALLLREIPTGFARPGEDIRLGPDSVIGRRGELEAVKRNAQDIVRELEREITRTYQERLPNIFALSGPERTAFTNDLNQYKKTVSDVQDLIRQFGLAKDAAEAQEIVAQIVSKLGAASVDNMLVADIDPTIADPSVTLVGQAQRVRKGFEEMRATGTASFNSLQNNMFQLGQAFEDAAIGFELNGITGAVRGASNNIAFLINNLSTTAGFQKQVADLFPVIGAKASLIAPLVASIGTAIGIVVIPRLVEWLESLNDIESQVEDVSARIDQILDDARQGIRIELDTTNFQRGVSELDDVKSVLERIRDLGQQTEDQINSLRKEIAAFTTGEAGRLLSRNLFGEGGRPGEGFLATINSQIDKRAKELEATLRRIRRIPGPGGDEIVNSQVIKRETDAANADLRGLESQFLRAQSAVQKLRAESEQGIFNAEEIRNSRDLITRLIAELSGDTESGRALIKKFDLVDPETIPRTIKDLETLQKNLDAFQEQAAEISKARAKQFQIGFDTAVKKTEELAQKQQILRRQLEGTADQESLFLFDVAKVSAEFEQLVEDSIKLAENAGASVEKIQKYKDILERSDITDRQNQILESQKDIIEQIREKRERIADLMQKEEEANRRSRQIDLERYAAGLQESVLSIENKTTKDNTDAVQELTDAIRELEFRALQRQSLFDVISAPDQGTLPSSRPFRLNQILNAPAGDFLSLPQFDQIRRGITPPLALGSGMAGMAFDAIQQAQQATAIQQRQTELLQAISEKLGVVAGEQRGTTEAVKQQDTKARVGQ